MRFKKIKIRNIRSYLDQEVEFPDGSFLLSGDIGSGKTSILLALEYALFGLQPGQKGSSLLRNSAQEAEVSLELEISEKLILIERKLKRTSKGVSNEYAAITIDGEKTESSLTEIKSRIVELLGYPQEFVKKNNVLYRYTVYSPQEQMKQIILEDPESRLNILRHVFGIDKYRQIKSNLSILLSNLKNESKLLQGEISTLEQDKHTLLNRKQGLTSIEEKIRAQESELENKTMAKEEVKQGLKELEQKIEERRALLSEIEKTKILVLAKRELLVSLNSEIKELHQTITEYKEPFTEDKYNALLKEMQAKKEALANHNSKYSNIASSITSLEKEQAEFLGKKERIFRIDICPTCLQNVPEAHKHNILNETERKLNEIKKSIGMLETEKEELFPAIKKRERELNEMEEQKSKLDISKSKLEYLEKSKKKLQDLEKQRQSVESDSAMLSSHINSLKEKTLQYSIFENQFKKKETELKEARLQERTAEISLAESKKELEWAHKEILLFEEMIQKKEISKKKLHNLNELADWLSTQFLKLIDLIERNVLCKLRSEFSSLFRKWFLMLVPEGQLDSQLDENFTPIIIQGGAEMDYSFLSGGERTAVALAYRLALNQTINSLLSKIKTKGIIILDEPTDGFSEAQIAKIRDILEELNAEQLIIVSHEQKIESFVDNVLKVVKEEDASSIEGAKSLNTSEMFSQY